MTALLYLKPTLAVISCSFHVILQAAAFIFTTGSYEYAVCMHDYVKMCGFLGYLQMSTSWHVMCIHLFCDLPTAYNNKHGKIAAAQANCQLPANATGAIYKECVKLRFCDCLRIFVVRIYDSPQPLVCLFCVNFALILADCVALLFVWLCLFSGIAVCVCFVVVCVNIYKCMYVCVCVWHNVGDNDSFKYISVIQAAYR